tara:strand:- start:5411 stop:5728 length:318 start_codon:yes stop_codon:yes gene_type:complete
MGKRKWGPIFEKVEPNWTTAVNLINREDTMSVKAPEPFRTRLIDPRDHQDVWVYWEKDVAETLHREFEFNRVLYVTDMLDQEKDLDKELIDHYTEDLDNRLTNGE